MGVAIPLPRLSLWAKVSIPVSQFVGKQVVSKKGKPCPQSSEKARNLRVTNTVLNPSKRRKRISQWGLLMEVLVGGLLPRMVQFNNSVVL